MPTSKTNDKSITNDKRLCQQDPGRPGFEPSSECEATAGPVAEVSKKPAQGGKSPTRGDGWQINQKTGERGWKVGGVYRSYVSPHVYRTGFYRFLPEWARKWGNYERWHPSDESGLPVHDNGPTFVSYERWIQKCGEVADLGDPFESTDLPDEVKRLAKMPLDRFISAVNDRLAEQDE